MNQYESIIIIDPNAESDPIVKLTEEIQNLISNDGGKITKSENWGKKKLAYEVKGNKEGTYVLLDFEADPIFIEKLERYYRLNEQIIKYMTLRAEDIPEPRQREITKRKFDDDDEFPHREFERYADDDFDDYDYNDDE